MKCPVCGLEIRENEYLERGESVEKVLRCICGEFEDIWSYGNQSITIKNKSFNFTSHPYLTGNDAKEEQLNWALVIAELKKQSFYNGEYDTLVTKDLGKFISGNF